ncbi:MAG: hypothetical protein U9N04_04540 [Patescibacteria group bacterium]|nr:hypothetical protein [Patescibacteria group bacterium]
MELPTNEEQEGINKRARKYCEEVSSAENSKEIRDETLKNVNEETAEVLDAGEQTTETAEKLGDNDSEGGEIIVETQKITDETEENRANTVDAIEGVGVETDISKIDADEIEGGMREDRQKYEDETAKINKEWEEKSEEDKKEEIEEYKEETEKDPRVMEVREKMEREKKTMGECVEELRKETKDIVKNRSLAMAAIQEQLNKGANFSELSGVDQIDQKEAKTALGEISRIANNRLTNEKLNYLLQFEDNLGDLLNEHKNRESTIENFEEIVKMIGDFEDRLREFEEMGEIEQQEAREEIKGLVGWLEEVYKKNPKLWKYLLGIGVVAGVLVLASIFGVPVSGLEGEIPFGWREAKIAGAGAAAIVSGGYLLFSKRMAGTRNDLKEGAKFLSGGLLGGAFMLAGYLFDEKRRDDFMKKASGVDFPGWYYSLAPKKEDSGK